MAKYNPKDAYYQRAKRDSFAARSVYKLEEIDQRFKLFKKGMRIVDLGCSPGSWLQYLAEVTGERGLILGYDMVAPKVNPGSQVHVHVLDVLELLPDQIQSHAHAALHPDKERPDDWNMRFDALVSDMMPKTTGIRDADQAKSIGVVEAAFHLAQSLLADDGIFVSKIFQGRGFDELLRDVRSVFHDVRILKPKATRQGSRESFIVARNLRPT